MDGKVRYDFKTLIRHYKKLTSQRDDIVLNLGLQIKRDEKTILSLVDDLKAITKEIDDFERKIMLTDEIEA